MAFELKTGYGPFGNTPVYIIGEYCAFPTFSWIPPEHIIGSGVIYYPLPLIQLGSSLGINLLYRVTEWNIGFVWNISAAFDLGKKNNHGCLIGLEYLGTFNKYDDHSFINDGFDEYGNRQTHNFGIFVKYAYRKNFSN